MAVHKFEDLIVWQRARVLTGEIYRITRLRPFSRDFGLSNQLQRSATSIMANIAEGFGRNRPQEFARYLTIARGSNAEVLSHLYVAWDVGYIDDSQFTALKVRWDEIGRLISGLLRGSSRDPGPPE